MRQVGRAHRARGEHEVPLRERKHLTPHQARDRHPSHERDGDDHLDDGIAQNRPVIVLEGRAHEDDEEKVRERVGEVSESHR